MLFFNVVSCGQNKTDYFDFLSLSTNIRFWKH